MKNKRRIVFQLLFIFFLAGCTQSPEQGASPDYNQEQEILNEQNSFPVTPLNEFIEEEIISESGPEPELLTWQAGQIALPGKYADADIVSLGNGQYRMYYSAEPEVAGFKGQAYSAVSSDGKNWVPETGIRMEWATFPSVIKIADGKYRMYYQNQGVIKSAISSDGLRWEEEPGIRMDKENSLGLRLENVAAPTVLKVGSQDIMVYRGTINEKYPAQVPNNNIQLLLWATSTDGLAFEKKGMALDSRTDEFKGLLDGPELVEWDNNEIRLYFWSYKGVYHVTYLSGRFSAEAIFDYTTNSNALNPFPENPPGDPTLAKIDNRWFLYYGQHTKGIYYAVFGS